MNKIHSFMNKFIPILEKYHSHEDKFSTEFTCLDFEIMDLLCDYEKGFVTERLPSVYDILRLTRYDEHLTKRVMSRGRFKDMPLLAKRTLSNRSDIRQRRSNGIDLTLENAITGYVFSVNPAYFNRKN